MAGSRGCRARGRRRLSSAKPAARSPRAQARRRRPRAARGGCPRPRARGAGPGPGADRGAAAGPAAARAAGPPLPAVRFLSAPPQASAGTLRCAARLGARRPRGSGVRGGSARPPARGRRTLRTLGGASARPLPRAPLTWSLSSRPCRNLPTNLPPRLEPCARRARNKHHS
ncbi:unnamed protein product [Nyctereutes procyonoides]|uniref:(raccoon dog) hypothetical protein n=1 Tax=Nyctereutes procyonoides TaxID=34880 RepID=A0A811Y8H2_NYCPR|nr:unnamed protein product [Nyctereutes procyonoides]